MKKIVLEFLHRGAIACGLGPIILALIYLILQKHAGVETLTVNQLCIGIFGDLGNHLFYHQKENRKD